MEEDELRAKLDALIDVTAQNSAAIMKLDLHLAKVGSMVLKLGELQIQLGENQIKQGELQIQQAELLRIHHLEIKTLRDKE
jgi:hypothetical protein